MGRGGREKMEEGEKGGVKDRSREGGGVVEEIEIGE